MRFTFMVLFIWWTLIERDQKGPSFLTFSPPSLGEVMLVWSKSSRTATWINLAYSGHSIKYIQYIQVVCANILYIYKCNIIYKSYMYGLPTGMNPHWGFQVSTSEVRKADTFVSNLRLRTASSTCIAFVQTLEGATWGHWGTQGRTLIVSLTCYRDD